MAIISTFDLEHELDIDPKSVWLVNTPPPSLQQNTVQDQAEQKISLEPPTPEKLFQSLWQKQGYQQDDQVFADFMSLVGDAQKTLEHDDNA